MDKSNQNNKMEYDGFMLRPVFPQDKIDWHKAQTLGPTDEELLTALYYDHSKWLEDMKTVCKRAGITLEQHLKKAFGLAVTARRVRDCNYETGLKLRGPERTGPDILLFFVKKCPHARDALLKGELPPYPWRISQSIEQKQKLAETKQENKDAKREREEMIQPKPPEIFQKILWIQKYGRKHWKLVSLAILIVLCIWILSKINLFS